MVERQSANPSGKFPDEHFSRAKPRADPPSIPSSRAESPIFLYLSTSEMAVARKSYLILGRLPSSPLMKSIQANHNVTHFPTSGVSRNDIIEQIARLPEKSFTFVLVVSEATHLYPLDRAIFAHLISSVSVKLEPVMTQLTWNTLL